MFKVVVFVVVLFMVWVWGVEEFLFKCFFNIFFIVVGVGFVFLGEINFFMVGFLF